MRKLMKKILGITMIFIGLVIFGMAGTASADPVTGYSTGSFDNLLSDAGVYASYIDEQTGVQWGVSPNLSTLLAGETEIESLAIPGEVNTGVTLAKLVWSNNDTLDKKGFTVDWVLSLTLTDPIGTHPITDNHLVVNLKNTGLSQDTIVLGALSTDTFDIDGYIFSSLRFELGAGSGGSLDSLNWKLGKGMNSTLLLLADFSAPPVPPVPEPGTLLLLGFGLVGLAGLRRRFKK